jgi:hypothetical protein
VLFLLCLLAAFVEFQNVIWLAVVAGLAAIGLAAGAGLSFQNYTRVRQEEQAVDTQVQEAINRVGMMVAAREAAVRMGGNQDALAQVEQEIRSLGGAIPRSLEEAQYFLRQLGEQNENLGDVQQRMKEKIAEANAARNQINVTMEALATLRKERARLREQHGKEGWDNLEENLRQDQAAVERMQQEITLLAGQEGLPLLSINARLQKNINFDMYTSGQLAAIKRENDEAGVPELESLVQSTIKATEHEMASLDGKLDLVADLAAQVQIHQDALEVLLSRQRVIEERNARYQTNSPALQIERAREQQAALRQALQSLQDSLRQRVKPLGVAFGQTAISSAETAARKQLESLQITLGSKIVLQEKHANYSVQLKERQESLSDHYKQLAKFSNTLGSWILPLNPFTEALVALRTRCQREMEEADEASIAKDYETLQNQEGASKAKIALCQQEIRTAQESIAVLITQHSRPAAKSYTLTDLVTVWPLLGKYSVKDRQRLEEERQSVENELTSLEEQELALSTQLQTGSTRLDLKQAWTHMEQQERSYQSKKRGNHLIKAVDERLMHKMLPRTEYYMQQILPLLTSGRYHDVHLTTEPEEGTISGGSYQLEVWDSAAGEYVSKSALSGGAADQLSLALRLAFAIAALPRELSAAPGFVLLDEPLSSFDRGRTQALVDVVTGEILSQHFEQILLISHSNAFDPAMFPYHVYMDNGLVVESNLPVVGSIPSMVATSRDNGSVPITVPAHVGAE